MSLRASLTRMNARCMGVSCQRSTRRFSHRFDRTTRSIPSDRSAAGGGFFSPFLTRLFHIQT